MAHTNVTTYFTQLDSTPEAPRARMIALYVVLPASRQPVRIASGLMRYARRRHAVGGRRLVMLRSAIG